MALRTIKYNPKDGLWYDKDGEVVQHKPEYYTRGICMPYIMSDIKPYKSIVGDEKWITSRSWRREDLIRNNCTEMDPPKHKGFKNARFARKRGLPLNPEICKDQNAAERHNRELHDAKKERRKAFAGRKWKESA